MTGRPPRPSAPDGAAAPSGPSGYLLAGLVVLVVAPPALVGWIVGAALLRVGVSRWRVATGALGVGALAIFLIGPSRALGTLLAGAVAIFEVRGRPALTTGGILGALSAILLRGGGLAAVTVPAGVLVATIPPPRGGEFRPEFDAATRARAARAELRARRLGDQRAARPSRVRSDALAEAIGGDLPDWWRQGSTIVLPARVARLPRLAVGRPNAGKSVLLGRETYLAGRAGDQEVIIDCKGEAGFAAELADAYRAGRADTGQPPPTIHLWPAEPLNAWACQPDGPAAVANRLLGCWEFDLASAWYREVCALALRLALQAPGPPVTSSRELIYRIDPGVLARLWEEYPDEGGLVRRLEGKNKLDDVSIRVANLMGALGGLLDGQRAIGDADLTVLSLPTMAAEHDAAAILRVVMGDLAHYVSRRKPPGRRLRVLVDEFSAVPGGRLQAIHLTERGRSAGAAMVLAVQSDRGLGSDEEADRLIGAVGLVALFGTAEPERLLKLAGTVRRVEVTAQVEDGRLTGRGTATERAAYRVDANHVRALEPGQAYLLAGGRAELVKIIEAPRARDLQHSALVLDRPVTVEELPA